MAETSKLRLAERKYRLTDAVYAALVVMMYAVSTFMFYRQTINYNGGYKADTSIYVNMSKEKHGVRLITWIYNWLYNLTGNTVLIALYMGLVVAITVLVNYAVMKWYLRTAGFNDVPRVYLQAASLMMLFTGSMYLPVLHARFYKASWCTYAWHSPTQQLMIMFGMLSLLMFLMIYENYMERISPALWIGLMITSTMSVWAKPSFMLVFIPTLIVVFLIELAKHASEGGVWQRFIRLFIFGCSMVPSGILILILNGSIYGEGSENKVAMSVGGGFGYNVWAAAFCGLLFPAIVFAINFRKFKELPFQIALGMLIMGITEWVVFHEVGTRGEHGNFAWGRQFGCYYFFLCAIVLFIQNLHDKDFLGGRKNLKICYFICAGAVLAIHVLSQMMHFYLMFRGHNYYI